MSIWPQLRFGICAAATAVYWSALAFLMHVPPQKIPKQPPILAFPHADKVIHGLMYAALTVLLACTVMAFRAMRHRAAEKFPQATALRVFGVIAAYGLIDELTQPLTKRHCDPLDFAADVVAAAVVVGVVRFFQPRAVAST